MRLIAITGIALFASSAVFAQDIGVAREKQQQDEAGVVLKKQMAELQARVPIENPVKGAPYSADVVVETTQALADGNHISHQDTGRVYRDSEGRTRREQSGALSVVTRDQPIVSTKKTVVSIVDPVAGMSYSLDTEHKIAWRTPIATGAAVQEELARVKEALVQAQRAKMEEGRARGGGMVEPGGGPAGARARGSSGDTAEGTRGPLQQKTIDGIPVEGRVNTRVIPAGAIGNDLPITITSEEWTSPELHVLVMTRHSDPRTGDTTYRLTNIVRTEPDPSLFVVPADFTIKDTGIRRPEPR